MNSPKSVQASVTILENLHIILKKCQKDEVNNEIMPLLYIALDNNTNQIQVRDFLCNLKREEIFGNFIGSKLDQV